MFLVNWEETLLPPRGRLGQDEKRAWAWLPLSPSIKGASEKEQHFHGYSGSIDTRNAMPLDVGGHCSFKLS